MKLSEQQFKQIVPTLSPKLRQIYLPFLNLAMARFEINTERRIAMFIAQTCHESNNLVRWEENLNYSALRLTQVWRRRFPTIAAAQPYAKNPIALANKTYGGRMKNRPGTNDGWNYRGRSPLQATGREMYLALNDALGKELNVDFVKNPDLLFKPEYGFLASAWIFAVEKRCNGLADRNQIAACTLAINGGQTGLHERKQHYDRILRILPDNFKLLPYSAMVAEIGHNGSSEPTETEITDTDIETLQSDSAGDFDAVTGETFHGFEDVSEVNADDSTENDVTSESNIKDSQNATNEAEPLAESSNGKLSSGEKTIIAVEKPKSTGFLTRMWQKITGVFGGTIALDGITDKLQQIQTFGLSSEFWTRIFYLGLAAGIIFLIVEVWDNYKDSKRDRELTKLLVDTNSTPDNIVRLVDADEIPLLESQPNVKIIRR